MLISPRNAFRETVRIRNLPYHHLPMKHLIKSISALGLIPILIITTSHCGSRESKTQGPDSTTVAVDLPFDTLVTFCNWTELGLRATPSEKGKYVTTVYLGEHLTLSGDTASEVNQGKKILFHKVALLDGTIGWLRDEFVASNAVPAVVVQETPIYKRPEETTMSYNTFHILDVVALKPSMGNWVEANGKPSDKTWFQLGYAHLENFSLAKRDVDFALLYRRAMETTDAAKQQ